MTLKQCFLVIIAFSTFQPTLAQLLDDFNQRNLPENNGTPPGWTFATGDGEAAIDFVQGEGVATIYVDATGDKRNIWWALIRRRVEGLDLARVQQPEYELRVEAKIKVSHAPRRVNLHFNTQRTTDFHSHLMEYDIPDTTHWHTISMTTKGFDARPGDQLNAQMALMDWGHEKYRIDLEYFKVDVVNKNTVGKDLGNPLPYHPKVPGPDGFAHHPAVNHDATIDLQYPDMNFNDWTAYGNAEPVTILNVNGTQLVILRWDMKAFRGKKAVGSALLELTTFSLQRSPDYEKDFGMVRVTEILGGKADWEQDVVTLQSFTDGHALERVLNGQMVIDWEVTAEQGGKTFFTITQPVLQRLIDGRTLGLAIRPLGAVNASFYSMEHQSGEAAPRLHFNVE